MYPIMKPISGINTHTHRISGVRTIHIMLLTATPDRMDTMMLETIRMLRPV